MKIFPAIDLYQRQVVRLYQGDYGQQEVFGTDPVAFVQQFEKAGAKNLHLVDLEGAKLGTRSQFDIVERIVKETNLFVELGGGIRTQADIEACLTAGVGRVILGTIAQKNPQFAKEMIATYGEKVAIGVDARDGMVAVEGWLETTTTKASEFCQQLADWGCRTIIYTDISRDGTGAGINVAAYEELNQLGIDIVASGGVATIQDIKNLAAIDTYGAIIGKAFYSGAIDLAECIKVSGVQ